MNLLGALSERAPQLGSAVRLDGGIVDGFAGALRRPIDRRFYASFGRLNDLAQLAESVHRAAPPAAGPKVLVGALRMWVRHNAFELVLAHALRLRGADIELLTCGGGQPLCEVGWGRHKSPRPCDRCAWQTDALATASGYRQHRLGDNLPWGVEPTAAPLEPIGSIHATAAEVSAAWFTKSSSPADVPIGQAAIRDYEVALSGLENAASAVLDAAKPDVLILLNGLFGSERILTGAAHRRGIEVVTHEIGLRTGSFVFGRQAPAPDLSMDSLWETARDTPLTKAESAALDVMLQGRTDGSTSDDRYFRAPTEEERQVRKALEIDQTTPIVAAFTNVAWDTAVLGKDIGFESMFTWLAGAIDSMAERPDAVLVIRVHPAEARWGTAQPVERELARHVGSVPSNVRVIGAKQPVSSYTLMTMAERVLTYTSTVGLEASVRGKPVAVAGATHYRGRGFTDDVVDAAGLRRLIASTGTGHLSSRQTELARRYAFAFFFQLMIPFHPVAFDGPGIARVPTHAEEIAPGRDVCLDLVCERILEGGDVVLPREIALAC